MKYSKILKKTICILCVLATVFAFTACSKSKKISSSSSGSAIPSNVGKVTSEGYELPYEYSDGHVAVAKIVDDSKYKNVENTGVTNTRYWLTTSKPKKEDEDFYKEYFKTLQPVKAKKASDSSVAYFDKERRIVISNLNVWMADGETNYQFGIEPCEDLSKSEIWEAK